MQSSIIIGIIGTVLTALITWYVTKYYYDISKKDLNLQNQELKTVLYNIQLTIENLENFLSEMPNISDKDKRYLKEHFFKIKDIMKEVLETHSVPILRALLVKELVAKGEEAVPILIGLAYTSGEDNSEINFPSRFEALWGFRKNSKSKIKI
jgi:hypothetical protein